MPLKYTCPRCGTTHRNIDKSLLGSKVQCACGKVSRLGAKRFPRPEPDPNPALPPGQPIDSSPPPSPRKTSAESSLPSELQPREMGSRGSPDSEDTQIRGGWDAKNPGVNVVMDASAGKTSGRSKVPDQGVDVPSRPADAQPRDEDSSPFEVIEDSEVFEVIDGDSDPVVPLPATPPVNGGEPSRPVAPREYGFEILEESEEGGPDALAGQSTPDSSVYNEDGLASPLAAEPVAEEPPASIPDATPIASQSLRSHSPVPQPATIPQSRIQPAMPAQGSHLSSTGLSNSAFEIILFITCILAIVFAAGLVYSSFSSASMHYQLAKVTRGTNLPWFLFGIRALIAIAMVVFAGLVMADLYLSARKTGSGIKLAKPMLMGSAVSVLAMQLLLVVIVSVGASPLRYTKMPALQYVWTFIIVAAPLWIICLLIVDMMNQRRGSQW